MSSMKRIFALQFCAVSAVFAHTAALANEAAGESAPAAAAPWGEPVEGVSLRLEATHTQWSAGETPILSLDVQNHGQRNLLIFQTLEFLGSLEVDGIWYRGSKAGVFPESPLPPGRRYEGLLVALTPAWRPNQDKAINPHPPPHLPLQLSNGQHTVRFSMPCRNARALPTKIARKLGEPNPEVVATSNPVRIEVTARQEVPPSPASLWGRAIEGVSVQLRAEHFVWTTEDTVALAFTVRNQGQRDLLLAQTQQLGEVEIDGVAYHWAGPSDAKSTVLPPGRQCPEIPITLTTNWQTLEGEPLQWGAAWHTLRFAVSAQTTDAAGTPSIRAISNPVQINLAPGLGQHPALVSKCLRGYTLRNARRGSGEQEAIVEIFTGPDGREIDLGAARNGRNGWRGTSGLLPPPGAVGGSFLDGAWWWRNPTLTALVPSLKLKIATAPEAQEIGQVIFGLFKGLWPSEVYAFKAEAWEHGWVVTPCYIGPPAQVFYQGPLELVVEDGLLKDARQRGPMFASSLASVAAVPAEPGWGEPVEGLSVRLQTDKPLWRLYEPIALRLSVRNLGRETLSVPESQELGELEIDGVWHSFRCSWSDPCYVALEPLAPGRQRDNIAVQPTGDWHNGTSRLGTQAGKHKIRFAVLARREGASREQIIRAISNMVEVEFR